MFRNDAANARAGLRRRPGMLPWSGMQVPKRRSQIAREHGEESDRHLSPSAVRRLEDERGRLTARDLPRAKADLERAREMGDLSENAAYSEAKGRLMRINTRLLEIADILKNAIVVTSGAGEGGSVRVGCTVMVRVNGKERTFEITGSMETDPAGGRISHRSPVGAALIGKKPGETAAIERDGRIVEYEIVSVE